MTIHDKWYVITGGPSTGKSTTQQELAKLGYATVDEAARLVIDDAVAKNVAVTDLREDEKQFQDIVVRYRVELEAKAPPNDIVFLDRGMQDSLAYYRYYQFTIEPWAMELIEQIRYGKIFLLEPLGVFKRDYARTEPLDFNDYISDLLYDAYTEYGMKPIRVPAMSVEDRVQFILEAIK